VNEPTSSLRRQLILRMLAMTLPLFLLLCALAYFSGSYFINAAFDRSLVRRTYALADRIEVIHGQVEVDLPTAAREVLAFDQEDLLSHSIVDPQGKVIDGTTNMPPLPHRQILNPGQVLIYDGVKDDEQVRVAAFSLSLNGTSAHGNVQIMVSETLTHRTSLAQSATLVIVIPMLLMTLTAMVAIAYGVGRGLEPVRDLRDRLMERPPLDLSPVPLTGTPTELRPFLDEINSLLLRLSEAIEAQSRFVADAAHQLRTPIAGIRAQAEAALASNQPQDAAHALQRIAHAADGMGNLVQKLLMLARVDAAENTLQQYRIDSADLMRTVAREWAPRLLAMGVEIGFAVEGGSAWIMGDAQLLTEMLNNLIDNAQRYGAKHLSLEVQAEGQNVSWQVADDGPGIPEHQRAEVLAPFHRLSGSIDGAGIGLTIVARIVHLHQATMSLGSNMRGPGLNVCIRFAAAPPADDKKTAL
jgi:two-component system sensor histidine kinase TctE